jgi:hypothetical protein
MLAIAMNYSIVNASYNANNAHMVVIIPLLDKTWLRRIACILLALNVAPYVVLDIVDFMMAETFSNALQVESAYRHVEKIHCIASVQNRLRQQ